jgi:hypothetical protein
MILATSSRLTRISILQFSRDTSSSILNVCLLLNIFNALILIITFNLGIEESEKLERLTDPYLHEIDGTLSRAPSDGAPGRLNIANQLPGLFNNCFFYLNGIFSTPSKADITQWIRHGGGTVLTRSPNPECILPGEKIPYHAAPKGLLAQCSHFILYDLNAKTQPSLKYNMSHVKTLSVDWLVACIENFLLVDPFDF